jgi:hypothetical protein
MRTSNDGSVKEAGRMKRLRHSSFVHVTLGIAVAALICANTGLISDANAQTIGSFFNAASTG